MNDPCAICDRYAVAIQAYWDACAANPQAWHRPDVAEFTELLRLLRPHAESGKVRCQYVAATILWLGLCCESEEELILTHDSACVEASRWWAAAAAQGFSYALDNLVTSGVGAEAERARQAWKQLAIERPDLIGASGGMPVYGPEFVEELNRRIYGRVITNIV